MSMYIPNFRASACCGPRCWSRFGTIRCGIWGSPMRDGPRGWPRAAASPGPGGCSPWEEELFIRKRGFIFWRSPVPWPANPWTGSATSRSACCRRCGPRARYGERGKSFWRSAPWTMPLSWSFAGSASRKGPGSGTGMRISRIFPRNMTRWIIRMLPGAGRRTAS